MFVMLFVKSCDYNKKIGQPYLYKLSLDVKHTVKQKSNLPAVYWMRGPRETFEELVRFAPVDGSTIYTLTEKSQKRTTQLSLCNTS